MRSNPVKQALKAGRAQVGSMLPWPSPELAEVLACAGCDFVVVDAEHGATTLETAVGQLRAAEGAGAVPLVRLVNDPLAIQQALDIGALGIQVAQVNTGDEARRALRAAKFHPLGERGANLGVRAARHGLMPRDEYLRMANAETLVAVQVENIKGVEHLEEILQVEGIDVILVAPTDLSASLGLTGQYDHPKVRETVDRTLERIIKAGAVAGALALSPAMARDYLGRGVRYIVATPVPAMLRAARDHLAEVRAAFPK
jgi:4-hydroxy-2-oxoheptanedioate aldolase